jgi:hypothetical protein
MEELQETARVGLLWNDIALCQHFALREFYFQMRRSADGGSRGLPGELLHLTAV